MVTPTLATATDFNPMAATPIDPQVAAGTAVRTAIGEAARREAEIWARRSGTVNPFANDDGSAPEQLRAALELDPADPQRPQAVFAAVEATRVLVPVIPHEHPGRNEDGTVVEHESVTTGDPTEDAFLSASEVTIEQPDGRRAFPVFSCLETMREWNPKARPVPVKAERAATAAIAEANSLLLIDPASENQALLFRSAVICLTAQIPWRPIWQDRALAAQFEDLAARVDGVKAITVAPGVATEVILSVELSPGLDRPAAERALAEVNVELARVRSLEGADSIELRPIRT
ncbi:MAG: SseB family protein [Buchananella hordeovulneris]|nr:SseB family protein [Buchananella hordeovulneris]